MKRSIRMHVLLESLTVVIVIMAGVSQAAELSLDVRKSAGVELRDGEKIATGRIICRESHTGFHVWMNGHEDEGHPGHYLIQGKHGSQNELRVRLEGEGLKGMAGTTEQSVFDVVADGRQRAGADEYVFSVSGNCMGNDTEG
ncbi:adhesin [Escherichia coli]|nr:adhesin [Escherichia coli]EFE7174888.1 adhesin [Escherichia coli]EFL0224932.1 adhesin [Escherichia coli]EGK3475843.1 adhesin [Escherichia coli]EIP7100828.1 adhesin [Escherichia coli]